MNSSRDRDTLFDISGHKIEIAGSFPGAPGHEDDTGDIMIRGEDMANIPLLSLNLDGTICKEYYPGHLNDYQKSLLVQCARNVCGVIKIDYENPQS